MSAVSRDELLARLSFLAPLFNDRRILCVGLASSLSEDTTNALAEAGATEITFSHLKDDDGKEAARSVWTDLTDVEDGGIDVAILWGGEYLCDEPWFEELRRSLSTLGRVVVIAPNPEVMGDGVPYDDIVAQVSPHFPSIELATETRMAAQVLSPYGADPDNVAIDPSLLTPQEARMWIFVCGEVAAGLSAETVALLDEAMTDDVIADDKEHRHELEEQTHALEAALADVRAKAAAEAEARALAAEALGNAEARCQDLEERLRRSETDRGVSNDLQRQLDVLLERDEESKRIVSEIEAARRGEHDARVRAERFATELEARHAVLKGELAQRETRVKRLVEEVQRLESELLATREDNEQRISTLVRERDDRRDRASRLARENESMRSETARLQSLLTRARDDLQLLQEQQGQTRLHAVAQRQALERETARAKEANDALIAASGTLNQRERTIEELRLQIQKHDAAMVQLQHENDELVARLAHAQETSAAHRSARERTEAALKGVSSEQHRLQGELLTVQEKLEVSEKRLADAEKRVREAEARTHETAAEYRLLLTAADSELSNGRHGLEQALAERATWQERAEQEKAEWANERATWLERAEQEKAGWANERAKLQAAAAELKTQLSAAETAAQAKIRQLENELRAMLALERDLQAKDQELRQVQLRKTETEAELGRLADKKTTLEATLERAEGEVLRLQKEVKDSRAASEQKVKTLDALLAEADAKTKAAERRAEDEQKKAALAQASVNDIDRKRVAAVSEAELHKQRADEAEEDAAALKLELKKAQDRVAELSTGAADVERQRDRAAAELKTAQAREAGLQKEAAQERARVEELLRMLDAEKAEIGDLKRQLATRASDRPKSDATVPSAAPEKKSQEWQVLDTFGAAEEIVDPNWNAEEEKTRIVK